jgi:hypothetical protein
MKETEQRLAVARLILIPTECEQLRTPRSGFWGCLATEASSSRAGSLGHFARSSLLGVASVFHGVWRRAALSGTAVGAMVPIVAPWMGLRERIRPGISGCWQVNGIRNTIATPSGLSWIHITCGTGRFG